MIRIGITGMSGSGKSHVCAIFSEYGIPSINADVIVHRLYQGKNPCTDALAALFGNEVLCPDHSVNRCVLASIVFSDREKLDLLNRTVHPYVVKEMEREAEEAGRNEKKAIILDAPQLFEAGMEKNCDHIIAVLADDSFKLNHIIRRDGITLDKAKERLSHQHSDSFFKARSDFQIYNSETADLRGQVCTILKQIGLLYDGKQ